MILLTRQIIYFEYSCGVLGFWGAGAAPSCGASGGRVADEAVRLLARSAAPESGDAAALFFGAAVAAEPSAFCCAASAAGSGLLCIAAASDPQIGRAHV